MKPTWPGAMAKRVGLSGAVEFTPSRVGLTLHIPCARGKHTVDVEVEPGLHPDVIAKRMLGKGWTIARKPVCPDCARKPKRSRFTDMPPKERSEVARKAAEARWGKKEDTEMQTAPPIAVANDPATPAPTTPVPSDAAKRAQRLIFQALEDYYDDTTKRYRPNYSDATIAKETGASEAKVKAVREEFFGPLGEPAELAALRHELGAVLTEIATAKIRSAADIGALEKRFDAMTAKLTRICNANGWLA